MGVLWFLCPSALVEWKSKSDDCEKEIHEWKKRASTSTTILSKLNRGINSKVRWAKDLF
jgi:hypothetical protein